MVSGHCRRVTPAISEGIASALPKYIFITCIIISRILWFYLVKTLLGKTPIHTFFSKCSCRRHCLTAASALSLNTSFTTMQFKSATKKRLMNIDLDDSPKYPSRVVWMRSLIWSLGCKQSRGCNYFWWRRFLDCPEVLIGVIYGKVVATLLHALHRVFECWTEVSQLI